MTDHDSFEPGRLIVGCLSSWVFPWGLTSLRHGRNQQGWLVECERVSAHLEIPPEQNPCRYALRYAVRVIKRPLDGLLCDKLLIWIIDKGEQAAINVTLHQTHVGGDYTLILSEICDPRPAIFVEALSPERFPPNEQGAKDRETWVAKRVRHQINAWWAEAMSRVFSADLQ